MDMFTRSSNENKSLAAIGRDRARTFGLMDLAIATAYRTTAQLLHLIRRVIGFSRLPARVMIMMWYGDHKRIK